MDAQAGVTGRKTPQPGLLGELRGVVQLPRLLARAPSLIGRARGHGRPVLVLPGRSVDDASTLPIRAYLRALDYDVTGWGLGRNDGDLGRLTPLAVERTRALAEQAEAPVALVGQSMGGAIAREVALRCPEAVRCVVTLGSPIMSARSRSGIGVPLTVIYSPADQVVPPHWALAPGDGSEVVEVTSTHFAMGFDPDVWAAVADRLGRSEGSGERSGQSATSGADDR